MKLKTRELLVVLLLTFIAVRFVVIGWHYMSVNSSSQHGDQGDYLQLGLEIKEHGTLTDGTRNPLYPAVISVFAQKDWRYFTLAKFTSLAFGILSVIVLFLVSQKLFDWKSAVVAAFLFGVNINLVQHSALALTTTLLILLFLLAWFYMVLALRQMKLRYWLLAGFLAGLAYLAKGTGQILFVSFVLSALLHKRIYDYQTETLLGISGYLLCYRVASVDIQSARVWQSSFQLCDLQSDVDGGVARLVQPEPGGTANNVDLRPRSLHWRDRSARMERDERPTFRSGKDSLSFQDHWF